MVIQAGMSEHESIEGAIQMRTMTMNMLLYTVAGASLFIGIDSGISNIAVGTNVPAIIFAGAVNPEYIYPDLSNVTIVYKGKSCDKEFCWHEVISTTGQPCYIDVENPPCTQYTTQMAIDAINKRL
jgi:ADP-heptose:LPS heptosyltransferase